MNLTVIMKTTINILVCSLLMFCASCSKKQEKKDIIVPPPAEETAKGPQKMSDTRQERDIEWLGNNYKITIVRAADKDLPMVKDGTSELEYYDNTIKMEILRADGSCFFSRTFHKSDFSQYIHGTSYVKTGVLLGIVFDTIKDDKLYFAASVGAPDVRSDEYVPLIMTINRMGEVHITLDNRMDTELESAPSDGITGDEEA